MIINIALLICFALMVYSYFVFIQDGHKYTKLFKILDVTNLTVADTYPNETKRIAYGQYAKMWFTDYIFKNCNQYLYTDYQTLYDGLQTCLPNPYCKHKGDFYKYVSAVLAK